MAYPFNYCPVEKPGLEVGIAHLSVLEALRADDEARNFPTAEEIWLESAAFHRMAGQISTR